MFVKEMLDTIRVETFNMMMLYILLSTTRSAESDSEKTMLLAQRPGRLIRYSVFAELPLSATIRIPTLLATKSHFRAADSNGPSIPLHKLDCISYS
jgi:hypothetical protein